MSDSESGHDEIQNRIAALKKKKLQISAEMAALRRRAVSVNKRKEAQALCALGRSLVELYDYLDGTGVTLSRDGLKSFLVQYVQRDADLEAIRLTLGRRKVSSAFPEPSALAG